LINTNRSSNKTIFNGIHWSNIWFS
jgi:hypothetical protein